MRIFLRITAVILAPTITTDAAEQWRKVTSSHFEVYTTDSTSRGKTALQYFEQVRDFFIRTTNLQPNTPRRTRVVAFTSEKQFEPYKPNEVAAAYYTPGVYRDTIVMRDMTQDLFRLAVHEYVHLLIRHSKANYPLWLNEGTADLFSTLTPVGKKVRVGEFVAGHHRLLLEKKWMPFEELFTAGHDSRYYNERNRAGTFYAQSWALVHMLNLSKEYRTQYPAFLKLVLGGTPAVEALRSVYSKDVGALTQDMEVYLRNFTYTVTLFDTTLEKSAEAPDVADPDGSEVDLVLAELLMNQSHRKEGARERYEKLTEKYPRLSEPHEALGYIDLRESRGNQAAVHFGKAAELGSKNAKMYYDWSWTLQNDPNAASQLIGALHRAIELDPDFFDARYRLGIQLLSMKSYGASLAALRGIKRVEPEKASQLFLAMAYAAMQLQLLDEAKGSAERAKKYAKSPAAIAEAERLIAYVEQRALPPPTLLEGLNASEAGPSSELTVEENEPRSTRFLITRVTGVMKDLVCSGTSAKLIVETDNGRIALWIEDPAKIAIRGVGGAVTMDFNCGPQPGTKATVGFLPYENKEQGTTGTVRLIELLK